MRSSQTPLITRFAPSPSGPLHLGHAYAAIIAHEAARFSQGTFLLRIEDLDIGRARPEFERGIFDDLSWLGLQPDQAPLRQSERLSDYRSALAVLEAAHLIYPCFCTRKEIAAEIERMDAAPHDEGISDFPSAYPGTCRTLEAEERERRIAAGAPYVLRLDMARALARAGERGLWPARFAEAWAEGAEPTLVGARPDAAGDIVLARKDFPASYHLVVVVDDAASGVSAVTRGQDLLPSTHIHVLLQRLLGLATPAYGHHALVRDAQGKRLAKRDDAASLSALRAAGWDKARLLAHLPPLPDLQALMAAAHLASAAGSTSR